MGVFDELRFGDSAKGNDDLVNKILGVTVPVKAPEPVVEVTPESLDAKQLGDDKVKEDLKRLHEELEEARDGRTEDNIPVRGEGNNRDAYWVKRDALQRYLHELKG